MTTLRSVVSVVSATNELCRVHVDINRPLPHNASVDSSAIGADVHDGGSNPTNVGIGAPVGLIDYTAAEL